MAALSDVAIIAFAQTPLVRKEEAHNEVEMLMPVVVEVLGKAGLTHDEIGFVCSGSSDYLAGQAFSFVMTLDSVGPWPPISESPRRHGRRLGALRGLGEDADRQGRHRARLLRTASRRPATSAGC